MMRTYSILAMSLLAWVPVSARGADIKAVLANVPSEAAAFVCLPNLNELDGDVQRTITNLGLDMFVQPPMNSIVTMLKMNLPMLGGLDENQPVAFVLMPITSMQDIQAKSVLLFSAAEPKAVLEGLGGTVDENGVWAVNIMGQSQFAVIKDKQIALGDSADAVQSAAASKTPVTASMQASDLAAMKNLDLIVWVNAEKMFTPLKPMINGMLMMVMMQAQAQGHMNPAMMDQTKKSFEDLVDGLGSLMVGVSVRDSGIGLRGVMTTRPGSELAAKMKIKTTTGSLLTGLPGTTFIVAMGEMVDRDLVKSQVDQLDTLIGASAGQGVDEAQAKKLVGLVKELATMIDGIHISVEGLDEEAGGLFGLSVVVETTDAPHMIELKEEGLGIVREIVKGLATETDPGVAEKVAQVLDAMTFTRDAEKINGVSVYQFKIDHEKIGEILDADENDISMLLKVVGEEGLLFRGAAINQTTVVSAFGGGAARFAKLIASVKSKSASLNTNAGIKNVASSLPKARASVFYIDANELLSAVQRVRHAVGEDALPVQLPKLDAPLAMSTTGGSGWAQFDLFAPTALIRGIKDAAMAAAVSQVAPNQVAPNQAAPSQPAPAPEKQ